MSKDNIIYVGSRPPMTYVMAVMAAINNTGEVVLKARGRAITTAVDAAEICRNRYLTDLNKPKIEIGTESLDSQEGGKRNVSSISITLTLGEPSVKEEPKEPEPEPDVPTESSGDIGSIKGVGKTTEEKLRSAGYDTVASIASADADTVAEKTGISAKVASKIIEAAKDL
jgi:DNA-binding protein